jgi:hypothetical protein
MSYRLKGAAADKVKGRAISKNEQGEIVETQFMHKNRPSGGSKSREVITTHDVDPDDPSMYDAAYNKLIKRVTKTSPEGNERIKTVVKEGGRREVTRTQTNKDENEEKTPTSQRSAINRNSVAQRSAIDKMLMAQRSATNKNQR